MSDTPHPEGHHPEARLIPFRRLPHLPTSAPWSCPHADSDSDEGPAAQHQQTRTSHSPPTIGRETMFGMTLEELEQEIDKDAIETDGTPPSFL
jgi:hypothetical protein